MIIVDKVSKYYGAHCAVSDLSFTIRAGECVGFLGLNGAGKSTTLRLLACLLLPTSGRIRVRDMDVVENPHAWSVASRCAQEALDVGRARGVDLDIPDCDAYVLDYGRAIPDARPSLLLDLLAGRPTEVEWINGSVPREGAKVGVPAPANELVTRLVLAKQAR